MLAAEARRPGTVRAAWLFEPIVFPSDAAMPPGDNPMAAAARRRHHDFDSFDAAIERLTGRGPFAEVEPRMLRDYVEHGFRPTAEGVTLKSPGEMEARVFEGIDLQLFDHLGEIGIDVTVAGSGDGGNPAQVAPRVVDALPHGRFEPWPDHSHFGPFEDSARAAAAIISALT